MFGAKKWSCSLAKDVSTKKKPAAIPSLAFVACTRAPSFEVSAFDIPPIGDFHAVWENVEHNARIAWGVTPIRNIFLRFVDI